MFNLANYKKNANIKITMRYDLKLLSMAIIKNIKDNKCCCTLAHWRWKYQLTKTVQKTVWQFLKKLKTYLQCDPAIPQLGVSPKATKSACERGMCSAALYSTDKIWYPPQCPYPSMDDEMRKTQYLNKMEYYSKKEGHFVICDNIVKDVTLGEINQAQKELNNLTYSVKKC